MLHLVGVFLAAWLATALVWRGLMGSAPRRPAPPPKSIPRTRPADEESL